MLPEWPKECLTGSFVSIWADSFDFTPMCKGRVSWPLTVIYTGSHPSLAICLFIFNLVELLSSENSPVVSVTYPTFENSLINISGIV